MIKVNNLAKVFGAKRAVDGISFSVERGEVLGFLVNPWSAQHRDSSQTFPLPLK